MTGMHAVRAGSKQLAANVCSFKRIRAARSGTRARTYPFWRSNTHSLIDWRAEAATCEGITLASSSARSKQVTSKPVRVEQITHTSKSEPSSASEPDCPQAQRTSLEQFHTLSHAGHPQAYGINTQEQVIKALLMNDVHAEADVELAAEDLDPILTEAIDSESLEAALEDYGRPRRHVVHSNGCIDVVDSGIGDHWQRDIINSSSPAFTQSCLLLEEGRQERHVRHDRFPAAAMNFRLLSAAVLLQAHLSEDSRDWGALHQRPTTVAIVGAGACAVPAVIHHTHPKATVHAVDIDNGMLKLARSHMDVQEDDRLKLHCQEGLKFMQEAGEFMYDVVILDVAASDVDGRNGNQPGPLLAPTPAFISGGFFGPDAVCKSLKPDGLLAVNVLGPELHAAAVKAALTGFASVHEYELSGQSILFATRQCADCVVSTLNEIMMYQKDCCV